MKKNNIEKKALLIGMYAIAASSLIGCSNKDYYKGPIVFNMEDGNTVLTPELSVIDLETPYARENKIVYLWNYAEKGSKKIYRDIRGEVQIEIKYDKFGRITEAKYPSQNLSTENEFGTMVDCNVYSVEPLLKKCSDFQYNNVNDTIQYEDLCSIEDKLNEKTQEKTRK